jgi:hypothetical protein
MTETLTYNHAMQYCRNGYAIRRPHWSDSVTVRYDPARGFYWSHTKETYRPICSEATATDWKVLRK